MLSRDRIEAFRQRLREGQPVQVRNGEVVLEGTPAAAPPLPQNNLPLEGWGVPPDALPGQVPAAGVRVKPHEWGAAGPFWADATGEARALKELALLRQHYPGFTMDIDEDGTPYVHGWIGPTATLRGRYHLLVVLPPDYGSGPMPSAFVLEPELRQGAPHRFVDGSLCLDHSGAYTARSTLVTYLAWVAVWLVLYEGWAEDGQVW